MGMNQTGMVPLAVVLIMALSTVTVTIGTPVIVDTVDTQPDHPLYALERAGESIKGMFIGGQDWEIERAQERDDEFVYMVDLGKADEYTWLVEESDVHLLKAAKLADGNEGLQRAIEANVFHLVLLENVKERVPAEAKPAIIFAQLQSYASVGVLENVAKGVYLKIPEPLKVGLDNRLRQIRVAIENLRIENVEPPEFTIRIENYGKIRLEVENAYAISVIENLRLIWEPKPVENMKINYENIILLRWEGPKGTRPMMFSEYIAEISLVPFDVALIYSTEVAKENLVYILVSSDIYGYLENSLIQYAKDLEKEGYRVEIYSGTWGKPKNVKDFLQDAPSGIVGCLLVGNIPTAWYEIKNDYGKYGHVEFPIDLYCMDLDGTWIDGDGDGIFDDHIGDKLPEIYVGRLKADTLSGEEESLLKDYFDRNHEYRKENSFWVPHQGALVYVDDDWVPWADDWSKDVGLLFGDRLLVDDKATTDASDYRNKLRDSWTLIQVASHSWPGGHRFYSGDDGYVYSSKIRDIHPLASFYNLFACSAARYVERDYIGGWYLFNEPLGLAVVGSTKAGSMLEFQDFYGPLSESKTIGESFKEWFTTHGETSRSWFYGMTLLGDPLLHIQNPPYRLGGAVAENFIAIGSDNENFKIIYWPENFIAIGSATLNDSGATPQTVAEVVDGNNKFAFDLYSQLTGEESNVFFSPWSISTALAMTYEGARGQTAEEMESVLHLPENDDVRRPSFAWIHNRLNENKEYELESANALWAQEDYPFLNSYFDIIQDYYGGKTANLDFINRTEEARKTINDWVSEKTRGKIEELIEEDILNPFTRLVLTNAIHFKGEWVKQFNENATHPEDFWVGPSKTVEVPMMSLTGENAKFNYMETEELEALEMPYKGEDLSILILLPITRFGLSDLEGNINLSRLNEIRRGLKEQKVNVYMPKFEFNTKYELPKTLKEMGMVSAFLEGIANFSGMDGTRDLFIQSVIHEAFVKVDEKGAEAAAATGVGVGLTAVTEKTFHADHPFMFIIQEKGTGNILFLGRVVNPSE